MTLTVELTPEESRKVEYWQERAFDFAKMIRGIISGFPDPVSVADIGTTSAERADSGKDEITS